MGCRVLEGCGGCSGCPGGLGRPSDERPAMIGRGYFSTEASNDCSVGASFPILSRRHRVSELFQLSNFPVPVYLTYSPNRCQKLVVLSSGSRAPQSCFAAPYDI